MEDSSIDFNAELQAALKDKQLFINETVLTILKDSIPEYRTSLETLVRSLKNAGILMEDRFQSANDPHELKIPPDEEVDTESKIEEISHRLSNFLRLLEFAENDYNLSLESISIERTEDLINFYNFINWDSLSQASPSFNIRTLAAIEKTVQSGEDSLIRGIFRDCKKQLSESLDRILRGLEDCRNYLFETYKLEIRNRVLPSLVIDPEAVTRKPDEAILTIKKEFRKEMGEIPFRTAAVREIVNEDYSSDAGTLRLETLRRISSYRSLAAPGEVEEESADEESETDLLFEGFRLLSAAGPAMLQVAEKLQRNSDIIENTHQSLFRRLINFLRGRKKMNPERIYSVVLFNAQNETASKLRVNLVRFTSELKNEANRLISLGNKSGSARLELEQAPAEEVLKELERHLKRLFRYQSVLPAVDQHLKNRANNAMRASMNGIKLDLNDLQSCLLKANKRRLEYLAQQKFGF